MPYKNIPSELTDKMDRCVKDVMAKGHSKDSAIAICYTSVVEGEDLGVLLEVAQRAMEEHYPWDQCIADQKARGYSDERAAKICGSIKAKAQGAQQLQGDERQIEHLDISIDKRKTGREWEITIIGAEGDFSNVKTIGGERCIISRNGLPYAISGIRESVPFWDGVEVFDNHLTDEQFTQRGGMRSPASEWVGTIVKPWWDDKALRLKGILKMVDDGLAAKLRNAEEQGVLRRDRIGLSIDTFPIYGQVRHEGRQVKIAKGFERDRICSVDIVMRPAAGGGFDRLIAATQITQEVSNMDITREELMSLIRELISEALAEMKPTEQEQVNGEEVAPEEAAAEVADAAAQAAEEVAEEAPAEADPALVAQVAADAAAAAAQETADEVAEEVGGEAAQAIEAKLRELETRMKKRDCAEMLKRKIEAAKLSPQFAAIVRAQFADKIFQEKEIDAMVKSVKEAQAAVDPSGRVIEGGMTRGQFLRSGGPDGREVAELEFLRLIAGNTRFRELEGNQAHYVQERVPQAYRQWIKAGRPNYGTRRISEWVYQLLDGDPLADQRAFEAVTTSGMSSIVKNVLNLMLAADYSARHEWWQDIVTTEEVDTIDQATLVRVYGLSTLSVVDEGGPYTELSWADEEETADFVKKGNYVGVTIESMLRDKLQAIRTIPNRLATSWYNTLSALNAGVFTVNTNTGPVLADGGALFNNTAVATATGHANLLTTALSFTAYGAARTAMMKQTDQPLGAGSKLLIHPKYLLVPVDLETTALQIRNSEMLPNSANNDVNPYYQKFEVVIVPEWTDTTDWAQVGDPTEFPAIWNIFLRGRRVPELFSADSETQGAMFTNDTLRYKVRLLTWRFSSTYDCAPVSDFRPLHKSNV